MLGIALLNVLLPQAWLSAEEVLVERFSDPAHWRLDPDRGAGSQLGQSKIEAVTQPVTPGASGAIKLSYDLTSCRCVNVEWLGGALLGHPTSLAFWLYGDGQKQGLTARLEDAAGQSFLVSLGVVDWKDWRKVEVPMEEPNWKPMRLSADEPSKARWPMTLRELRIERLNERALSGSLVFSELRTAGPVEPLDRVNIGVTADAPAHVFYQPAPVVLRASLENPSATPLEGRLETVVEDWQGGAETFEHGSLTLAPKAKEERALQVPLQALGAYRAWVRFRSGEHCREAPAYVAVSREVSEPAVADADSPFGVLFCEMRIREPEARAQVPLMIKLGREAGAKWSVLEGSVPTFAQAEGHFAWDLPRQVTDSAAPAPAQCRIDDSIGQMRRAGIHAFGLLMNMPDWMLDKSKKGSRLTDGVPRLDVWSAVVEATARHFAERGVHVWEIWNEPCSAEEYTPILAASYAAIKKADPTATVLGCAVAGPSPPGGEGALAIIEEVLKRGGGQVMDAVAIHPYQPSTPENPEFLEILRKVSDLTAKYGRRLPIWITEIGWNTGEGSWTEASAAKLVVRSYLLALAAGVEKVFWYDFRNDGADPFYHECNWGFLRHDFTLKPGYFAFRTMATELAGMKYVQEIHVRDGLSVLVFGDSKKKTAVAWAHGGSVPVAFRLGDRKELECVTLMGNVRRQPVRDGAVIETLTDTPIFLRNVPDSLAVFLPVECEPRVVKVLRGEAGTLDVTLRNPFNGPVELSAAGQKVALPAGGKITVTVPVSADQAAAWRPLVWRSPDNTVAMPTPVEVAVLSGQRAPILSRELEADRLVEVPDSTSLNVTEEVTVAFSLRVDGPTGGWLTPVGKSHGTDRNYLLSLHPETGELYFSGSYSKFGGFFDIGSGVKLCDGQWHRVAVTYSAFDAKVCIYIDGKRLEAKPNSAFYVGGKRICADSLDGGPLNTNTATVVIGGGFSPPADAKDHPHSAIRSVRIWNRALNAEEAVALE